MKKLIILLLSTVIFTPFNFASETGNYGASGAAKLSVKKITIPRMLTFALEDEYLAKGEYQKIMNKFGKVRPFSNIIEAEKRHISMLLPLFKKYKVTVPPDRGLELAVIPATFSETFPIGVKAEEVNIAMYQRFLKQKLPKDVKNAFQRLLSGSQNHLAAFSRKRGGGRGRGRYNHGNRNSVTNNSDHDHTGTHSFNIFVVKKYKKNIVGDDNDLSNLTLLFSDKDIVSFNWSEQSFTVTTESLKKIKSLEHLYYKFILFADNDKCYSGRMWSPFSSISSSKPVILRDGSTNNGFKIQVNYPKNKLNAGEKDIRFDNRIKLALEGLKKLK